MRRPSRFSEVGFENGRFFAVWDAQNGLTFTGTAFRWVNVNLELSRSGNGVRNGFRQSTHALDFERLQHREHLVASCVDD
jgi:hypothetical protein